MDAAVAIARMEQTLESHDERIKSVHKRLGETQVAQGDQHTELKVMGKEVEEARADIEDSKIELSGRISNMQENVDRRFEKMQDNFNKKFETLTTAVRWGTGAVLTLIAVLSAIFFQLS